MYGRRQLLRVLVGAVGGGGSKIALGINVVYTKNLAELKTLKLESYRGMMAHVAGYYAERDGGGGEFYWQDRIDSQHALHEGIVVRSENTGVWIRNMAMDVNVKFFGAKGDGKHNDWPAIEKALTYVNSKFGSILTFPDGVYALKNTPSDRPAILVTQSNVVLQGEKNTTLIHYLPMDEQPNLAVKSDTICLKGVAFSRVQSLKVVNVGGKRNNCAAFAIRGNSENCKIVDCESYNAVANAYVCERSKSCLIYKSVAKKSARHGVYLSYSSHIHVNDNVLEKINLEAMVNRDSPYCIYEHNNVLESNLSGFTLAKSVKSKEKYNYHHIIVRKNIFIKNRRTAIYSNEESIRDSTFEDNKIIGYQNENDKVGAGISITKGKHISILRNKIGYIKRSAIYLLGVTHSVVSQNECYEFNMDKNSAADAIVLREYEINGEYSRDNKVFGNVVRGSKFIKEGRYADENGNLFYRNIIMHK